MRMLPQIPKPHQSRPADEGNPVVLYATSHFNLPLRESSQHSLRAFVSSVCAPSQEDNGPRSAFLYPVALQRAERQIVLGDRVASACRPSIQLYPSLYVSAHAVAGEIRKTEVASGRGIFQSSPLS